MTLTNILLTATLIGVAIVLWKVFKARTESDPLLQAELDRRKEEIGELKNKIDEIKSENNELRGKMEQLFAENTQLKVKSEYLSGQVAEFGAEKKQRDKEHHDALAKMESADKSLADERVRIRREDEERLQREEEAHDRMWKEHENNVIAHLTVLCKKEENLFTSYTNTNLPEGFHGHFQPDFLIDFLGQYVIFDAKDSEPKNLQQSINRNVISTAKKAKIHGSIYSKIFFVIPTTAIRELKQVSYYQDGFTFYVVSPEALEPILASLKKIEKYEFAQEMDPQNRENIIDLIAQFNYHINWRNAADVLIISKGLEALSKAKRLDPEMLRDVTTKMKQMKHVELGKAEHKALIAEPGEVKDRVLGFLNPQPEIAQ